MELTRDEIAFLIRAVPGDCALYQVQDGRLLTLYRSAGLPGLSAMTPEAYDALQAADAAGIVLPCDRPRVAAVLQQVLRGGGELEFSYRVRSAVTGAVWVRARGNRIGELNGLPVLLIVFHGITEGAEEHAQLLSNTATAVYVIDRDTRELLYANEPAMEALHCRDYSGRFCYDIVRGGSAPCGDCPIDRLCGGFYRDPAYYIAALDRWFDLRCRSMDWHGRPAAAFYLQDITAEKKRAESLELDKKALEHIIDNIPVGIGVCEVHGGAVSTSVANPSITAMLGMSAANFAGANAGALEHIHPDDRGAVMDAIRAVRALSRDVSFDYRYRRGEGEGYRWYRTQSRLVPQGADGAMVFVCVFDITAEREAQAEMLRTRRMYKEAATAAKLLLWEYDPAARVITMLMDSGYTQQICEQLAIPRVIPWQSPAVSGLFLPESWDAFAAMYARIEAGGTSSACDICFHLPGQTGTRHLRLTCIALRGADGAEVVYGLAQETTAQRLEELRSSSFFNNPDSLGSFRLNLSRNLLGSGSSRIFDAAELRRAGTVDGYVNTLASGIADAEAGRRFCEHLRCQRLLESFWAGKTQDTFDFPARLKSGEPLWCRGYIYMYQNPETGEVEAVTYVLDYTRQHRSEEVIRRIMRGGFDYIALIYAGSGQFELLARAEHMLYPALGDRVAYQSCLDYMRSNFVAPDEREHFDAVTSLAAITAGLKQAESYTATYRRQGDGQVLCLQVNYVWLDRAAGVILATRTDVTAAYEREQQQLRAIERARAAAERANRAKEEFISRISHDIRTPISAITGMTAFAREDAGDREKLLADLDRIESSSSFLLSLINDVLDISKVDSGTIELHPEPCRLADFAAGLRAIFGPMCRQGGQSLVFAGGDAGQGACCVLVDRVRLNQIALNLLSNAVKYTPSGGTITCTLDSRPLPDGRVDCRFAVRDTGIGMSESFQRKMFEPFSQETDNPARAAMPMGTGLGLSIVLRIVRLMGGSIEVESHLGAGTLISVRLCLPLAAGAPPDCGGAGIPFARPSGRRVLHGRVLLAEDNAINTEIALRLLESFGLRADTAQNGLEAVRRFADAAPGTYGCVLMDLQMPLLNGYGAAAQIRALNRPDARTIPIIAMTADAFAASVERSLAAGMDAHLTKPINPELLYAALEPLF